MGSCRRDGDALAWERWHAKIHLLQAVQGARKNNGELFAIRFLHVLQGHRPRTPRPLYLIA